MPYTDETSDLNSTSKNIKHISSLEIFQSFVSSPHLKINITNTLNDINFMGNYLRAFNDTNNIKKSIYPKILCIDGSLISTNHYNSQQLLTMRTGVAFLDTNFLLNIKPDSFNNFNPYDVATLFNNINNFAIDGVFPSSGISLIQDNTLLTPEESFHYSLNYFIENNKNYLSTFDTNFSNNILNLFHTKNTSSGYYSEIKRLMLIYENILAQHVLNQNFEPKEDKLVILDGRMQNTDIGDILKEKNKNNNSGNSMIGVQKSGILNQLLSFIHDLIKSKDKLLTNKYLLDHYYNGNSILIHASSKFKEHCGIKPFNNGNYGRDFMYISQHPFRKEFVFTIPFYFNENEVFYFLQRIRSVFEYTHTDKFIKEKGAILANIIAHSNASLNIKQSKVLNNFIELDNKNTNNLKKKL